MTAHFIVNCYRFYATGIFQSVCGDLFHVNQSTVSRIVQRVTEVLAGLAPEVIKMPQTPHEITMIKEGFYRMVRPHGIPNVVGLIDCTHVKICSPGGRSAERFRNRKGSFSISVQAVARYDLKILDLVARWPGSTHDSHIFDMSALKVIFYTKFARDECFNFVIFL